MIRPPEFPPELDGQTSPQDNHFQDEQFGADVEEKSTADRDKQLLSQLLTAAGMLPFDVEDTTKDLTESQIEDLYQAFDLTAAVNGVVNNWKIIFRIKAGASESVGTTRKGEVDLTPEMISTLTVSRLDQDVLETLDEKDPRRQTEERRQEILETIQKMIRQVAEIVIDHFSERNKLVQIGTTDHQVVSSQTFYKLLTLVHYEPTRAIVQIVNQNPYRSKIRHIATYHNVGPTVSALAHDAVSQVLKERGYTIGLAEGPSSIDEQYPSFPY